MISKFYPTTGNEYTRRILVLVEIKRSDVALEKSIGQVMRYTQLVYDQGNHPDLCSYLVVGNKYLTIGIFFF